ncbi:hypothetical protein, partial [Streptomyces sp. SA15]|uniref:hypothetical protein n=1 Tax=Streptomyces sp. SA15 TaxID=934019 RepID=UPI0015CCF8D9
MRRSLPEVGAARGMSGPARTRVVEGLVPVPVPVPVRGRVRVVFGVTLVVPVRAVGRRRCSPDPMLWLGVSGLVRAARGLVLVRAVPGAIRQGLRRAVGRSRRVPDPALW